MQHTLEVHRSFPFIAWATVILFACFVGRMALVLANDSTLLAENRDRTEQALGTEHPQY